MSVFSSFHKATSPIETFHTAHAAEQSSAPAGKAKLPETSPKTSPNMGGDDDFFKDYPPVASGDTAESSSTAIPLGPGGSMEPPADADPSGFGSDFGSPSGDAEGNGRAGGDADDSGDSSDDGAIYRAPPPEDAAPECAAVTAWRQEFAAGLEEKVRAEREGKAEKAERAKETLEKMQKTWEKKAEAAKGANAVAEKEMVRERDGVIARMSKPGEPPAWGVVPELIDMSGKFKEGARDTSRMRQVLLKLKTY